MKHGPGAEQIFPKKRQFGPAGNAERERLAPGLGGGGAEAIVAGLKALDPGGAFFRVSHGGLFEGTLEP